MTFSSREANFEQRRQLVNEETLEHTVLSAQQAQAQLSWLEKMHTAGLYPSRLAYPHCWKLAFEFTLPLALHPTEHTKAEAVIAQVRWPQPEHTRPQFVDGQPPTPKADN